MVSHCGTMMLGNSCSKVSGNGKREGIAPAEGLIADVDHLRSRFVSGFGAALGSVC
jgi:hypothetical protein